MGRAANPSLTVAALGIGLAVVASPVPAAGQGLVVRDGTLGKGPLEVGPGTDPLGQPATYLISPELGEQQGSNLFHSFARFDVGTGETATFTGPDPIDGPQSVSNVISRVTGGDPSEIDGTLRSTIPGADLWLLNPSGVVFGEGAQLDVPGSFHASTGDHLGFGEGGLERFYGDPARPSVLATARPEAFGFLRESETAPISVTGATLDVHPGETIELAGGDVTLTAATLDAPGGAISIRGGRIVVAEGSRVLAESPGQGPAGAITVEASDSMLVDNSLLSVNTSSAGSAGTIHVSSPVVTVQNGPGLGDANEGPRHPVNAPHATEVGMSAETSSSGAGGTIEIDTGILSVTKGVSVSARTFGLDATGDAGRIEITASSIELSDRAEISAGAWASMGDGGAIDIEASHLRVDGGEGYAVIWAASQDTIAAAPDPEVTVPGSPGRIEIKAGSVELLNGGQIDNSCLDCTSKTADRPEGAATVHIATDLLVLQGSNEFGSSFVRAHTANGEGDAGTIQIEAGSVRISSAGPWNPGFYAGAFGTGTGGTIVIDADSMSISDGGFINVNTGGLGDAGTIDISTRTLALEAGGQISANSITIPVGTGTVTPEELEQLRGGDAGTIRVTASESIALTNEGGERFLLASFLLGQPSPPLTGIVAATVFGGQGGAIILNAPAITIARGASVSTSTVGGGPGGAVALTGGNIRIVDGGAMNSASLRIGETLLGGDAGDVTLLATESIQVAGVDPAHLEDRSTVTSASIGSGAAGAVTLRAPQIVIEDSGRVTSTALRAAGFGGQGGARGDLLLDGDQVIVRSGGRVDASTFVLEPGGAVEVVARESILVEGEGSGIGSRTGGPGAGGNVSLSAPRIVIAEGAEVAAQSIEGYEGLSSPFLEAQGLIGDPPDFEGIRRDGTPFVAGNAGTVTLTAHEMLLPGGLVATNATDQDASDGGQIEIHAKDLVHLDAGEITASVNGGAGGNITIDPEVVLLENDSRIVAQAAGGSGGNIEINADNYFAFPGTEVSAEADRQELSGTVEVSTPDVNLAGTLAALPTSYLDAASLMKAPCAARRSGERAGSFAVRAHDGMPPEPDGWLPATLASEPTATTATRPTPPASRATSLSSPARLDGCR